MITRAPTLSLPIDIQNTEEAAMTSPDHTPATPSAHAAPPADDSMPAHPQPGLYRHYKGGLYTVLCTGRHSETEEWLVTYRSETLGTYWVRPLAMWMQTVNGQPRLALLDNSTAP